MVHLIHPGKLLTEKYINNIKKSFWSCPGAEVRKYDDIQISTAIKTNMCFTGNGEREREQSVSVAVKDTPMT